jgi:hypothetical protein
MRPRPETALLLASLLLGLWLTADACLNMPGTGVPRTHFTDGHIVATVLSSGALVEGEGLRFWTDQAGWPDGLMLRPLLWPVILAATVIGPAWALTLGWALTPLLGAVGGITLARVLGAGVWGRFLCGALLAWAPWVRLTLANGQVEQSWLGAIALVWAAAVWAERGRRWRVGVAPAALLGLGIAGPNLGLTAALGLGILAVVRVLGGHARWGRTLMVLALSVGATLAVNQYHGANFDGTPNVFAPRLRGEMRPEGAGLPSIQQHTARAGWHAIDSVHLEDATLESLVVPLGPNAFRRPVQHSPFLGYAWLLAAGLAVVRRRREALPWVAVAAGLTLFSMGSSAQVAGLRVPLPWALIEWLAPAAKQSGTPFRIALGAVVALAAAAGLGDTGDTNRENGTKASWKIGLVAVVLSVLAWTETTALPGQPLPLRAVDATPHAELASLVPGSTPVLDLPLADRGSCQIQTPHYLTGASAHDRPYLHSLLASPNFHAYGKSGKVIRQLDHALGSDDCVARLPIVLTQLGVGAIVAHQHGACSVDARTVQCLHAVLGLPQAEGTTASVWVWR